MRLFATRRQWAGALIFAFAAALLFALAPFATAFIGALMLYVVLAPLNTALRRVMHPAAAASISLVAAVVAVLVPTAVAAGLLVNEIRQVATEGTAAFLFEQLQRVELWGVPVAPRLERAGEAFASWLESSALGILGSATRLTINATIAFFTLFFLFRHTGIVWPRVRPFIPFTEANADRLIERFRDVTFSTVLGSGLTAVAQGTLVGLGFWVLDLPSPAFWGLVTGIFSILPILGSGLVWIPASVLLATGGRTGAAIALAIWGAIVVANVDMVIRPWVFRRWADIHPLITVIGALAGVPVFGLLGLLIGPLALSYIFELLRMYREEYLMEASMAGTTGEIQLPGWRVTGRAPERAP